MNVGILALHGNVAEHKKILESLGAIVSEVRTSKDLEKVERLLIPGGESTVISKLLWQSDLSVAIQERSKKSMPIFGTCAGAIIVASVVVGSKDVKPLQLIEITIDRNAYGRQIHSFDTDLQIVGIKKPVHVSFIRAPIIKSIGAEVEVLASVDDRPVLVKSSNVLACTCHPEVHGEVEVHSLFLDL